MATQAYCAKLIGISERRFRELIDEGIIPRAEKSNYDLEIIVPAYCKHIREIASGRGGGEGQANKADADARRATAQAEMAEMDAAEQAGRLVPADRIGDVLHGAVLIMKTKLTAVPAKVAPLIFGIRTMAECERVLRDQIDEALAELAATEVLGSPA